MKSPTSLKSQIFLYVMGAFLVTSIAVAIAYVANRKIALTQTLKVAGGRLQANAAAQADQLLPGLLVIEESASIPGQLQKMKDEESLSRIEIFSAEDLSQQMFGSCERLKENPRLQICVNPTSGSVSLLSEIGLPEETVATLVKTKELRDDDLDGGLLRTLGILLGSVAISFLILLGLILLFVERHIRRPLMNLKTHLTPVLDGTSTSIPEVFRVEEMKTVAVQVQELIQQFENRKTQAALGEVAAQVVHDIRSPISVLSMIGRHADSIPETDRRLLESATARIRHITDDLLHRYKSPRATATSTSPALTFLLSTVDRIVAEKRVLAIEKNIQIYCDIEPQAAPGFVAIEAHTLGRVLSNLIDNSFEAFDPSREQKQIRINVTRDSQQLVIVIEDNGRGIAKDILPKIGVKGATFHKPQGTGLGIYHARTTIESAGGRFILESTEGVGTKISLSLKLSPPPAWFCQHLNLQPSSRLVIVDDDLSIHELFRSRFSRLAQEHCHSDFLSVLQRTSADSHNVFLMDNKLSAEGPTGVELIQKFYIASRATLMTSDFESPDLQRRVVQLGCQIIPKPLLPFLEITMG